MCQFDDNISTYLSIFKGIRDDVDQDFVKVTSVNPYRKTIAVVLEFQIDLLVTSLFSEERAHIIDERNHIRFTHVHSHLSLVDFSQIHHLVDEVEYTLGISSHSLVNMLMVHILILLHQLE